MKLLLSGLIFFFCTNIVFPDSVPYSDIKEINMESRNYNIKHFHNWSRETLEERQRMITSDAQNPFDENNNYAYIEVFNKETKEKIIHLPTPALTHLFISEDERYIVGISNIMIYNLYHLIIVDINNGLIIKKRHIASEEAKLNENEFVFFRNNFPNGFQKLQSINRIYYIQSYYYIDFLSMNMPVILGNETWCFLLKNITNNHLSDNMSETVTNYVFWFNEKNPNVSFNYRNNELFSINIADPKNKIMEILLYEN
jgi:hypothetical protein